MHTDPFASIEARLALGPDEFAKSVGIGRTQIFAEIKAGRLKARKFGQRTLIYDRDGRGITPDDCERGCVIDPQKIGGVRSCSPNSRTPGI